MSAKKRRVQRQIARLVRMDKQAWTRHWYSSAPPRLLWAAAQALGRAISKKRYVERAMLAVRVARKDWP